MQKWRVKMNKPTTLADFLSMYKPQDIIYPTAVARHCHLSLKETYKQLYVLCNKIQEIRPIYMVQCPICGAFANQTRYYSLNDVKGIDTEIYCEHCDNGFVCHTEENIKVLFKKKEGES